MRILDILTVFGLFQTAHSKDWNDLNKGWIHYKSELLKHPALQSVKEENKESCAALEQLVQIDLDKYMECKDKCISDVGERNEKGCNVSCIGLQFIDGIPEPE